MKYELRWYRVCAAALAMVVSMTLYLCAPALAANTGSITGTVTDATTGAPVSNVQVMASSPSSNASATTDAHGFFSLVALIPETYTVSFQHQGYEPISTAGVTVMQDATATLNEQLHTQLKTIASVRSSASTNLVKPNEGSDVYTVGGQQLQAATNPVDTHETLYQYLAITPGVTGNGFPSQPRIRGGQVTDLGYEFDGIPIQDRITGFFTSNLANIGISNIEVYSGGLPAYGAANGTGFFNSVVKTGTYPGYTSIAYQGTSPESNVFLTLERGYATPNHRFSYYVGFDGVNSQNEYDHGQVTFPGILLYGFNGPGPVRTRDWVGNFTYHPSDRNNFQFLITNSFGDFNFNYLLNRRAGEPLQLSFLPCTGNTTSNASFTGYGGGTAPNGQTCPTGLYFGPLGQGQGNIWHHYGGLGKIQWNHIINDKSFFALHFAENFNQYIFDQPIAEGNIPSFENPGGGFNWANDVLGLTPPPGQTSACPLYPYAAGTPVQMPQFLDSKSGTVMTDTGDLCATNDGVDNFWGDRHANQYFGNLDYTNNISAKVAIKAGISDEYDTNVFNYFLTNGFNADGSWPDNYLRSNYPTTRQQGYFEADLHVGKFLLSPGVLYAQEHYGFPNGGKTQHAIDPTFNGTYTFDPRNVVRFSYGNTSSFIGTGYVYRQDLSAPGGFGGTYNPSKAGFSFDPQINHSADLMFEHQIDANTSVRVGPWYNKSTNYFQTYKPFLGFKNGVPIFSKTSVLANGAIHHATGAEFALNHTDNRDIGTSYWVSATYDNYWGSTADLAGSFVNTPLPQNLIAEGTLVRQPSDPLFSGTILADFHSGRFHLDPLVYYQEGTFFNTGVLDSTRTQISQNEQIAAGYWITNLGAYEVVGPNHEYTLGFKVSNLLDNHNDVTPCTSGGNGCNPFNGPQSGVVNQTGNIYQQTYTQNPRLFYLYFGVKM
jgi:hypothetical protein